MKTEKKPTPALVPCPAILLSVAGDEKPNIITLSWAANVCSNPPTLVVGIRPNRFSHDLVRKAGDFVVNIPSADLIKETIFCGSRSGKDHDKFEECKLTPLASTKVTSPMIKECPINIECKTEKIVGLGAHDLFIAEIVAVHVEESILDSNGRLDPEKANLFTYLPLAAEYWKLGEKIA
ncbi:flavin reductase family protein [Candidatus Thorarchaeota archaeon]|nr:MAG: flavin reductase family protein [Candidatus Thorarchaeota archaeon]